MSFFGFILTIKKSHKYLFTYGIPLASYYNIMIDIKETKVKKLESINFCTIALTSFDAYMMTVSGTHIKIGELGKVMNQPIKDFIIGDA